MRQRKLVTSNRQALLWYLLGFVAIQFALGVGTDTYWLSIRDWEFDEVLQIVQKKRAESPDRPLVLFLGSSRVRGVVRAGLLNHPDNSAAPVVINTATLGAGPIMNDVCLQRFLDAGIRPELIFVEAIPMSLSAPNGATVEEFKNTTRFSAAEFAHVLSFHAHPADLCGRWVLTRAFPFYYHDSEMRTALAVDVRADGSPLYTSNRDAFGWAAGPKTMPQDHVQHHLQENLKKYHRPLTEPAVAPGTMLALRSLVNLSRKEHIAMVFVVPPESSAFRYYCPAAAASQLNALRTLADELGVAVLDHSGWVDDDGFTDGHHATEPGADQYTERFAKEVFEPMAAKLRQTQRRYAARGRD
jgi:hypothetical protein